MIDCVNGILLHRMLLLLRPETGYLKSCLTSLAFKMF